MLPRRWYHTFAEVFMSLNFSLFFRVFVFQKPGGEGEGCQSEASHDQALAEAAGS